MKLQYSYWLFPNAFGIDECNKILEIQNNWNEGTVGSTLDLKVRDSKVMWISELWIYHKVFHFMKAANKKAKWNFDVDWCEDCQLTQYTKDQYYHWHRDTNDNPYDNPKDKNFEGNIRKITSTLILSNPEDFKGGEFEFCDNQNSPIKSSKNFLKVPPMNKGSFLCFPSHIWHRVKPIESGTRYSVVSWFLGKPFK